MRLPKYRSRVVLVAATFLAVFSGLSADDKPLSGDLAKLQGSWRAKTGPNGEVTADLEVQGTRAVARLTQDGREVITVRGKIALGEKAEPKTFDMVLDGEKESGFPAIYRIDGDTFTICTGTPQDGRPRRFEAGEKGVPALKVYKRIELGTEKSGR